MTPHPPANEVQQPPSFDAYWAAAPHLDPKSLGDLQTKKICPNWD